MIMYKLSTLRGGVAMEKQDVVCGMEVDECEEKSDHKGKTYCFCSSDCKEQFDKSPQQFIK